MKIPERAETDEEKRAIIERLYALWTQHPQLRLGQLLLNCLRNHFYHMEDEQLIGQLERYYKRLAGIAEMTDISQEEGMYD